MADIVDLDEKTGPILLLENRRRALIGWLTEGQKAIADAETAIKQHKQQAIDMTAEIEQIEAALNTLNKVTENAS